jgi:hypothetical protein
MDQEPKKPWYKFKDDPLARIFFGAFMLVVTLMGDGINFSSAEASGKSTFSVFMLVLCVWLIISGIKLRSKS